MNQPEIDVKTLLYNSLQFRYHKHIRTKYKIKTPQIQVLSALYYVTILFNPPQGGVKSQLYSLLPHIDRVFINRSLSKLVVAGLIEYDRGDGAYNYSLTLTPTGIEVIESLFTVGKVEEFLNSKVKGLDL